MIDRTLSSEKFYYYADYSELNGPGQNLIMLPYILAINNDPIRRKVITWWQIISVGP